MRRHLASISVALALLHSGCSFLEPREDPTRYFVLSPTSQGNGALATDPGLGISLGPLQLPDYLLRPEIVRRAGQNELEPTPVDRWAEPIDAALLRVLRLDLAALLPQSSVFPFHSAAGEHPAVQVEIELATFEADLEGTARLEGRFRIRYLREERQVAREFRLKRPVESDGTQAMVAAMSTLLADLARQIAVELSSGR